jgi:hypothetical protein
MVTDSVSDTDPDSIRSEDPDSESRSWSRRAKTTHKNRKKLFFEVPDVLFRGLMASPVAWTSYMGGLGINKFHFWIKKMLAIFFQFLVIKTLDPDPLVSRFVFTVNAGPGSGSTTLRGKVPLGTGTSNFIDVDALKAPCKDRDLKFFLVDFVPKKLFGPDLHCTVRLVPYRYRIGCRSM